jgi:hypothetical protein
MRRRDLLHQLGLSVPGGIVAGAQFIQARPQNARSVHPQKAKGDASTIAPEKGTGRTATQRPRVQGRYVNRPLVQVDVKALRLLDDMEDRAAKYFFEQADPTTGSVYDRARADGMGPTEGGITHAYRSASSISATGFGLSGLCIAAERGYLNSADCERRVETVLEFFATRCEHEHGFFYHYIDIVTGARIGKAEVSSIDTSFLLCGVLHCRQYFNSRKIDRLASAIYERIDWPWMLDGGQTLSMGWTPEDGFIRYRWDIYAELLTMYLLAIGSPTCPLPASAWNEVKRPEMDFGGIRYITGQAPLFIHQYPHAWCDFRDIRDQHANYFTNSVAATRAHQLFCLLLHGQFPQIDQDIWGISASESRWGYRAWGGPPAMGPIDGTIAPNAAGGSLPFLPAECSNVLLNIRSRYPKTWQRYGFVDSFQPSSDWYCGDVIAIDLGIMMLMSENMRTGMVWKDFMKNEEIKRAMKAVGFRSDPDASSQQL